MAHVKEEPGTFLMSATSPPPSLLVECGKVKAAQLSSVFLVVEPSKIIFLV